MLERSLSKWCSGGYTSPGTMPGPALTKLYNIDPLACRFCTH